MSQLAYQPELNKQLARLQVVLKRTDPLYPKLVRQIHQQVLKAQNEIVSEHLGQITSAMTTGDVPALTASLSRLDEAYSQDFSDYVLDGAKNQIQAAYTGGTDEVIGKILNNRSWRLNRSDREALHWLREDFNYWVGNHWGNGLSKDLSTALEPAVLQGVSRAKAAVLLENALGAQFDKSKAYWEGMANHVVTRARTFGVTEGMVRAGATHYRIDAVRDDRTSPICSSMHGRIFTVKQAVDQRTRILAAELPEDIKKIAPWVQAVHVQGKATKNLPKGLEMPPYHFGCRTTITIWDDAAEGVPAGIDREDWSSAKGLVDSRGSEKAVKNSRLLLARHFDGALRQVLDRVGPNGLKFLDPKEMPGAYGLAGPKNVNGDFVTKLYKGKGVWEKTGFPDYDGISYLRISADGLFRLPMVETVFKTNRSRSVSVGMNTRMATTVHELGHAYRLAFGEPARKHIEKYQKYQHTGPTKYSRTVSTRYYPGEEFFAECWAMYILAPTSLQRLSPKGFEMVQKFIDKFKLKGQISVMKDDKIVVEKAIAIEHDDSAIDKKLEELIAEYCPKGFFKSTEKEREAYRKAAVAWGKTLSEEDFIFVNSLVYGSIRMPG